MEKKYLFETLWKQFLMEEPVDPSRPAADQIYNITDPIQWDSQDAEVQSVMPQLKQIDTITKSIMDAVKTMFDDGAKTFAAYKGAMNDKEFAAWTYFRYKLWPNKLKSQYDKLKSLSLKLTSEGVAGGSDLNKVRWVAMHNYYKIEKLVLRDSIQSVMGARTLKSKMAGGALTIATGGMLGGGATDTFEMNLQMLSSGRDVTWSFDTDF